MRIVTILPFVFLLAGCSVLDGLDVDSGPSYGPSKIYLDDMKPFMVPPNMDRDSYACMSGPLLCEKLGTRWECHCP